MHRTLHFLPVSCFWLLATSYWQEWYAMNNAFFASCQPPADSFLLLTTRQPDNPQLATRNPTTRQLDNPITRIPHSAPRQQEVATDPMNWHQEMSCTSNRSHRRSGISSDQYAYSLSSAAFWLKPICLLTMIHSL